jgi:predicted integral membrane protein DUF2269
MRKLMKLLHYIGLIIFLGSILSYILISALAKGSTPANLVFALQVINAGVKFLTVPELLVVIVTGVILTVTHYGFFRARWLNIKHTLIVIIAVNTFVFILLAETDALRLAQASLDKGTLLPEYVAASTRSALAGGIMVAAVWRFQERHEP